MPLGFWSNCAIMGFWPALWHEIVRRRPMTVRRWFYWHSPTPIRTRYRARRRSP